MHKIKSSLLAFMPQHKLNGIFLNFNIFFLESSVQKKLYFFLMLNINSATPNPFEPQNFGLDANAGFNFSAGMENFDPDAFYK